MVWTVPNPTTIGLSTTRGQLCLNFRCTIGAAVQEHPIISMSMVWRACARVTSCYALERKRPEKAAALACDAHVLPVRFYIEYGLPPWWEY